MNDMLNKTDYQLYTININFRFPKFSSHKISMQNVVRMEQILKTYRNFLKQIEVTHQVFALLMKQPYDTL